MYNLETNKDLVTLPFDDEESWLELRKKGIGGSDIGAIMGLNKYMSALTVYKVKVEGLQIDLSDNANVRRGKDLEDLILKNYVRPYLEPAGYTVEKPDFMIINNKYPFLRANVDGIAYRAFESYKDILIVEIKTVTEWAEQAWFGEDYCGIPASYYAQVQHYMCVTGAQKAIVCAFFDRTWEAHFFEVPRDEGFIVRLLATAKKFYVQNMTMCIPPRADATLDKEDIIEGAKKIDPLTPKTESAELDDLINKYLDNEQKIKKAEKIQNDVKSRIFELYNNGFCPTKAGGHKVNISVISSKKFNTSKFKEAEPDMYNQYVEESESMRSTIK